MREFDQINNAADPTDPLGQPADKIVDPMTFQAQKTVVPLFEKPVPSMPGKALARGCGLWFSDTVAHTLGVALGFGQVMILVAIASALATRLTFVVNLVLCLLIYFLGHLAPFVVQVTESASGGTVGVGLVGFLGKLFDVLLPALEFFNMGPAIIRETPARPVAVRRVRGDRVRVLAHLHRDRAARRAAAVRGSRPGLICRSVAAARTIPRSDRFR